MPLIRSHIGPSRHFSTIAGQMAGTALLALVLAGCVTTQYQQPQAALATSFVEGGQTASADNSQTQWWSAFRDPQLARLIERGLVQNLSVQQALERISEAGASVSSSGAGALPSVSGSVAGTISQTGSLPVQQAATAGGNASWLLDLFGQYRQSREAALASLDAAYLSVGTARLTFLSEITRAYVDLRYYQEALALTRLSIASRSETLKLTEALMAEGAGARLDVLQAQSALDAANMDIPTLELGFIAALNRLATLTAQPAADLRSELQKGAPQPWPRLSINAGLPADLVRQRPDIRAAERDLAAAVAQTGAAEAALYPSLSLGGAIQVASLSTWSFGPTLNLPFLDGGRSQANLTTAQSRARQSHLSWQSAVLQAVEETENALAAVRRDTRTLEAVRALVKTAEETLALTQERYQAGESRVLDVLDAQRSLFDAQMRVASATQNLAKNFIGLNVAIGGGADILLAR